MNELPLVSIVIPTFNAADYLSETISSVAFQKYKNFECIIVDDMSTDSTLQLAKNLIKKYGSRFKLISLSKNSGGPAIPRNIGINNANGKYISFLDADDTWHKDKLLHQVSFLEENTDIDLVATTANLIDQNSNFLSPPKKNLLLNRFFLKDYILWSNFIPLSSSMIRNKKFLFNENSLFIAIEDWLMWIDLTYGKKNYFIIERPLINYRILENSLIQRDTNKSYIRVFMVLAYTLYTKKISLISFLIASMINLIKLIIQNLKYQFFKN